MARIIIALLFLSLFGMSSAFSSQGMDAEARLRLQKLYGAKSSKEATRNKAFSRAAIRKSKTLQKLPAVTANAASYTRIEPTTQELEVLITASFSLETLEQALAMEAKLARPHPRLEEYIALSYWSAGNTSQARDWSQAYLARNESVKLHKHLMLDALSQNKIELALFHLNKSDLSPQESWPIWFKLKLKKLLNYDYAAQGTIALLCIFGITAFIFIRKKRLDCLSNKIECKNKSNGSGTKTASIKQAATNKQAQTAKTSIPVPESSNPPITIKSLDESLNAEQGINGILPMLSNEVIPSYGKSNSLNKAFINDLLLTLTDRQTRIAGFTSLDQSLSTAPFIGSIAVMLASSDYKVLVVEISNQTLQLQSIFTLMPGKNSCRPGNTLRLRPQSVVSHTGLNILQMQASELDTASKDAGVTALLSFAKRNYDITLIVFPGSNACELAEAFSKDTENILDIIVLEKDSSPDHSCEALRCNDFANRIIGRLRCFTP